jgi:hypothetical protein
MSIALVFFYADITKHLADYPAHHPLRVDGVDGAQLATMMVDSARRTIANLTVFQLSPMHTPALPGVDYLIGADVDARSLTKARAQAYAAYALNVQELDSVFVDTDLLFQSSIAHVFHNYEQPITVDTNYANNYDDRRHGATKTGQAGSKGISNQSNYLDDRSNSPLEIANVTDTAIAGTGSEVDVAASKARNQTGRSPHEDRLDRQISINNFDVALTWRRDVGVISQARSNQQLLDQQHRDRQARTNLSNLANQDLAVQNPNSLDLSLGATDPIGGLHSDMITTIPCNAGVIFARPTAGARRFWQKFSNACILYPAYLQAWYCDQVAIASLLGWQNLQHQPQGIINRFKIRLRCLPSDQYNYSPNSFDQVKYNTMTKPYIVHFQGQRKQWMVHHYRNLTAIQASSSSGEAFL